MKTIKQKITTVLLVLSLGAAIAQTETNLGIGIRAGDPSGITIKKYFSKNALELNIGRTQLWNRNGWYDNRFDYWYKNKNYGYEDFQYLGYRGSVPLSVQLHYLFQNKISKLGTREVNGLDWYFGIGGQFRYQTYTFDYRYKLQGNNEWFYATGERVTDIDLGVDGVLGLEYKFQNVPLSVFTDVTLFMEVVDSPFIFWYQAGLGIRYNF